ncbi:hypothetical protein GLOIN_2v1785244 [Rhizophagus irregularis DAOM 181602=DAOM 197198]|uniref:TPR-like protein n=1 Tax=Rhizophagus irregularis (strain DAOM 181602 / DAOM 197198 / MUCL 43194) TaxID=747089 RepID=A0A2P4PAX8_RHIID|nr:hypothetical protein GLOIN_2v1785244 [Rhizophagus irregularis DAOM 181602=DAOM 197198]POG62515.1 hypothetical protein GLOIN_2v1785244 [Rhizophagus irregularis DAOM 181602=DAOM 197198]|eukprot:XP_025169381.1 hypothetical protein GLOIN_2v1785244 [Rhizophagus irregularis DAOM 181602=DAOM 197198]
MLSSKLMNFNKINLLPLRNIIFYETQPKYSLYSIFLRQLSSNINKKLKLHEKILQSEKDIKKLERKISAFDKQVINLESDKQQSLSEDFLSQIHKAISAPPEIPRFRHNHDLKLPIADEKRLDSPQELSLPTVSDLQASKREQIRLLTQMKKENLKSIEQFNNWLYACALTERVDEASDILFLMEKAGVIPNAVTYDHLINLYASVGELQKAIGAFDLIEAAGLKPTVHSFTNLIKAYNKHNRVEDAFNVYLDMKIYGLIPTQPIFTTLIKGCIDNGDIVRAWITFDHMRLEVCQPDEVTFSLMIHACAKGGNTERAFDLYQEMKEKGLCPTDVTFNSLIHASFKLLQEMREYGYQPDITTCNSLMFACSKNGDLQMARSLLITMMQRVKTDPLLTPDELTFTNLFWTYSTYKEPMNYINRSQNGRLSESKQLKVADLSSETDNKIGLSHENHKVLLRNEDTETENNQELRSELTISEETLSEDTNSRNHDLLIVGSDTYPFFNNVPVTVSQTVKEAEMIFNHIITSQTNAKITSSFPINLSPKLVISYLNILVKKSKYNKVFDFYKNFIPKYNIQLNGWIFLNGLTVCYKHKRVEESWSIWRDWENWRKEQSREIKKIYDDEHDRKNSFKKIGMTEKMEYEIYKLMIKILARCNEIHSAIRLLQNLSNLQKPDIQDFTLLLQKCVENDEMAYRKVFKLCYNSGNDNVLQYRNSLAKKWKGRGIKLPPKNKYDEKEKGLNHNKWRSGNYGKKRESVQNK